MSLILFAVVVILLALLVIYLIDRAPFGDAKIKWILDALVVVIAVLVILSRTGLVSG